MPDSQNMHRATFEVGPSGHINGEKVQLVYTAVRDSAEDLDYRVHALRFAIDAEARFFGSNDDEDPAERMLERASKFHDFLRGGSES